MNGYVNYSNYDITPFSINLAKLKGSLNFFQKVKYMLLMLEEKQWYTKKCYEL